MREEANAGEPAKVEPETRAAESPDIEGCRLAARETQVLKASSPDLDADLVTDVLSGKIVLPGVRIDRDKKMIWFDMESFEPMFQKREVKAGAELGGSEMDTPPKKKIKQPSLEQIEIAQLLLDLSENVLARLPKKNSDYITLDGQEGANKNAVSVCRGSVVFMVQDWTAEEQAKHLELETRRKNYPTSKRLEFPGLTTALINANREFFKKMLTDAKEVSKSR
jgi:hypothetical protein